MFFVERTGKDLVLDLAKEVVAMSDESFQVFVNGGIINEQIVYVDREEWENAPEDGNGKKLKEGPNGYYVYTGESINKIDLLMHVKSILSPEDANKWKIINEYFSIENYKENLRNLVINCSPEKFDMIMKILTDNEVKSKFLDFENNKELFEFKEGNSYKDYRVTIKRLFGDIDLDGNYKSSAKAEEFFGDEFQNLAENANEVCYPVNEELKKEVLKDMPKNLDKQEISVYVYTKLCSLLSYDQKYLFAEKYGYDDEYKKGVREANQYAKGVTSENNLVICHDFNNIFVSILRSFGINAKVSGAENHTYVQAKTNEFYARFDSTIIKNGKNDMLRVKLGEKVEEIAFTDDISKGQAAIDKVYQLSEFSGRKPMNEYIKEFLATRERDVDNVEIDFDDSMSFVLDELKKADVNGLSALLYMDILRKNKFFGEDVEYSYIGTKKSKGMYDRNIMIRRGQGEEKEYYLVDMEELKCSNYTKEEINRKFLTKNLVYQNIEHTFEGIGGR